MQAALRTWGEQTFEALFEARRAGGWFDTATADNYSDLTLRIQSDDPRILAWPWKALRDHEAGAPLAHFFGPPYEIEHRRPSQARLLV